MYRFEFRKIDSERLVYPWRLDLFLNDIPQAIYIGINPELIETHLGLTTNHKTITMRINKLSRQEYNFLDSIRETQWDVK